MQAFVHPGFDINSRGVKECTLLHDALICGLEMMRYILQLEGGTKLVNARTSEGFTPLHSVSRPQVKHAWAKSEIEWLLQHGADIYARNNCGNTPAHFFIAMGEFEWLQVLLDAGFDLQTRGQGGKTVLHTAIHGGGVGPVEHLLELPGGRQLMEVEDNYG